MIWPVTEAVAVTATRSGSESDFDEGMALLAELTSRLTAEFAIRTFLETNLDVRWRSHSPGPAMKTNTSGAWRPKALVLVCLGKASERIDGASRVDNRHSRRAVSG